jgi:hypothetical protein
VIIDESKIEEAARLAHDAFGLGGEKNDLVES